MLRQHVQTFFNDGYAVTVMRPDSFLIPQPLRARELAVIGAGAAGLSAAICAARLGVKVSVFERRAKRRLLPHESLHPSCEALLRLLDVWDYRDEYVLGQNRGVTVNGFSTSGAAAGSQQHYLEVDSAAFETALARRAVAHGVYIHTGATVEQLVLEGRAVRGLIVDEEPVAADMVIDASGPWELARHALGLRRKLASNRLIAWRGLALNENRQATLVEPQIELDRSGWKWLTHVYPGIDSWTLLRIPGSMPCGTGHWVPQTLRAPGTPIIGADVTWRITRPLATEGLLLAGDAACVTDPYGGQGIRFALWSGSAAARAAEAHLRLQHGKGVPLAAYEHLINNDFEARKYAASEQYRAYGVPVFERMRTRRSAFLPQAAA